MTEIPQTFDAAHTYLTTTLPSSGKELFTEGRGIERSREFFTNIGDPQEAFPTVHIAGTSGKGTVGFMMSYLLCAHDKHIGLHTSPHVYDIRERAMIDNGLVTEQDFTQTLQRLIPAIKKMHEGAYGRPTYFEVTNAIAFTLFKNHQIDYGIIETGLGGLYDSTNNIQRQDKLAVITSLGFDHVEVLGNTLGKIASQKAGILPYNGEAVVLWPSDPDAQESISRTAEERNTTIYQVDDLAVAHQGGDRSSNFSYTSKLHDFKGLRLRLPGRHQAINATVALRALERLAQRDNFDIEEGKVRQALMEVNLPGRYERQRIFDHEVIIDGAHNPQKMAALVEALDSQGIAKTTWVLALKKTKDATKIMQIIAPKVDRLVLTSFFNGQEGPSAQFSMPVDELAYAARAAGIERIDVMQDNIEALQLAVEMSQPEQPVVVSGSFYMIGDLHQRLSQQGLLKKHD